MHTLYLAIVIALIVAAAAYYFYARRAPRAHAKPAMSDAEIKAAYGQVGLTLRNCALANPTDARAQQQCAVRAMGPCQGQGFFAKPNCTGCNVGIAECSTTVATATAMRAAGLLPPPLA